MKSLVNISVLLILCLIIAGIANYFIKNNERNAFMNECMTQKTYEQCEQDFLMKRTESKVQTNMQMLENNDIYKNAGPTQPMNSLDVLK